MKVSRRSLKARLSPDYRAKELGGLAAAAHQILGSAQQSNWGTQGETAGEVITYTTSHRRTRPQPGRE